MHSPDNTESDWLNKIKSQYNVKAVDFTRDFPEGIVVFRGSNLPPSEVFKNGFKPSTDEIWIEDSSYLLSRDRVKVYTYVQKQKKSNRTIIPDQHFRSIVLPGANSGLISTTLSPKKASRHVCLSFLEETKTNVLAHNSDDFFSSMQSNLFSASDSAEPIGYVYAVRIKRAINISVEFQWADLSDSDLIEQEMACYDIPACDVISARPIYGTFIPNHGLICSLGLTKMNRHMSSALFKRTDESDVILELGTDESLGLYNTLGKVGAISFFPEQGQFQFVYDAKYSFSLDDSKFSRQYIKSKIAKTKKEYLDKLQDRQNKIKASPSWPKKRRKELPRFTDQLSKLSNESELTKTTFSRLV